MTLTSSFPFTMMGSVVWALSAVGLPAMGLMQWRFYTQSEYRPTAGRHPVEADLHRTGVRHVLTGQEKANMFWKGLGEYFQEMYRSWGLP
jgi:hypothetical protein